tara:strand:- start:3248 stop:3670 length:423 start_codon:yes stop_codon:yes gene_type:complete
MPKSKIQKKKLFRESSRLNQRYVKRNYLKNLREVLLSTQEVYDVFQKEIMFMMWAYDLEFWTLDYAAKEYGVSKKKLAERTVFPLVKVGYIYKHFDKLTPSNTYEDHLFRDETKFNYRVRYALTQKARLLVQRVYRDLDS